MGVTCVHAYDVMWACVRVRACVCLHVHACVYMCMHACTHVCVWGRVCMWERAGGGAGLLRILFLSLPLSYSLLLTDHWQRSPSRQQ